MVAEVVRSVLASMRGDLASNEISLLSEVEALGRTISTAKADIAALRFDDINDSHIPFATDELDAIVSHTAAATNAILECCETLDEVGTAVSPEVAAKLTDVTTRASTRPAASRTSASASQGGGRTEGDRGKVASIIAAFGDRAGRTDGAQRCAGAGGGGSFAAERSAVADGCGPVGHRSPVGQLRLRTNRHDGLTDQPRRDLPHCRVGRAGTGRPRQALTPPRRSRHGWAITPLRSGASSNSTPTWYIGRSARRPPDTSFRRRRGNRAAGASAAKCGRDHDSCRLGGSEAADGRHVTGLLAWQSVGGRCQRSCRGRGCSACDTGRRCVDGCCIASWHGVDGDLASRELAGGDFAGWELAGWELAGWDLTGRRGVAWACAGQYGAD